MKAEDLRSFALSLPETSEQPHFDFASFRVLGKIFATMPPDEKHAHVFVPDEDREQAVTLYPEFIEPLIWGKKVAGIRISLAKAKPKVVNDLVRKAWIRKAPKRLASAAV